MEFGGTVWQKNKFVWDWGIWKDDRKEKNWKVRLLFYKLSVMRL